MGTLNAELEMSYSLLAMMVKFLLKYVSVCLFGEALCNVNPEYLRQL